MIQLKENQGIPRNILLMMAIIAGLTVANCYYNQPLLELIRHDIGITEQSANLITVITQIGYALGLFFLIPLGDMFSRKRLILFNMSIAAVMAIVMAVAQNVWMLWGASLLIGACSVIPQFFIPIAGQFSAPKNKSRNMGFVLSGLLTGILSSRVISGYIGEWLGWREMFIIAAFVMLSGIVVNAGIYLIPTYQSLLSASVPEPVEGTTYVTKQTHRPAEAANIRLYVKAYSRKINPITLTIVSTILGLLPFLTDGPEEVFWFDFAVGTISGMLFSILAVIFILPIFCVKRK